MLLAIPVPHCDGGCGRAIMASEHCPTITLCRLYTMYNFVASADHMLPIYTVDSSRFLQQKNVIR